jgi:predicted LPLAT superfamily acyltransferase
METDENLRNKKPQHWGAIPEKGSYLGLSFLLKLYQLFGRWLFLLVLHPVVLYYTVFYSSARTASRQYLQHIGLEKRRLAEQGNNSGKSIPPSAITDVNWRVTYSHFYAFGESAIDKIAAWNGDIRLKDVNIQDEDTFASHMNSGKGAVFIGSHLGNMELCRALGEREGSFKVNAVVFHKNALMFQKLLKKNDSRVDLNLIHVEEIGIDTAIRLRQKVDAGEVVVIVGDRTSVGSIGRIRYTNFLGVPAPFSEGPFILASLLECPVYLLFCIKQDGRYNVHLEYFADSLKFPRSQRSEMLAEKIQEYADRLAYYCIKAPLQWFNFYDFWRSDSLEEMKLNAKIPRSNPLDDTDGSNANANDKKAQSH